MERSQILNEVKKVIVELSNCSEQDIHESSVIYSNDINLSSIDMINLIVILEEKFEIEVPDELLTNNLTVKKLVDTIAQLA